MLYFVLVIFPTDLFLVLQWINKRLTDFVVTQWPPFPLKQGVCACLSRTLFLTEKSLNLILHECLFAKLYERFLLGWRSCIAKFFFIVNIAPAIFLTKHHMMYNSVRT